MRFSKEEIIKLGYKRQGKDFVLIRKDPGTYNPLMEGCIALNKIYQRYIRRVNRINIKNAKRSDRDQYTKWSHHISPKQLYACVISQGYIELPIEQIKIGNKMAIYDKKLQDQFYEDMEMGFLDEE